MASSDDFPLIDSSSSSPNPHAHAHSHLHANARHDAASYYSTEAPFNDAESDPSNRPGGPPGAPTPPKRTASPYNYYKKHKCSNSGESENESYRKDREEWSDTAIACLLEAYTEKYNELNRGNLRGRDWEEVAEAVTDRCGGGGGGDKSKATYKSVEQCKNKIDNLKKRYKVELQRMSAATGSTTTTTTTHSHWHWFKKIEAIVGNSGTTNKGGGSDEDRSISHARSPRQSKRYMSSNAALTNNLKSKPISNLKWRRVVFKISGTALAGNCQSIDPKVAMQVAKEVASACRIGVEVAIVVGGRNFFCGDTWENFCTRLWFNIITLLMFKRSISNS